MILNTKTVKIFIPASKLQEVSTMLKEQKIWHGPFRRVWLGYNVDIKADHPAASYFTLKYS